MNNMNRWLCRCAFLAALVTGAIVHHTARAVEVGWTFDNASLTPRFNDHTAPGLTSTMIFANGTETSDAVTFGAVSTFAGVPAVPGGDDKVMKFPAFTASQGLALYHLGPPNGGGAYINQYTMAWDILIPDVAANWFSFYQTNSSNANDGDLFVLPQPADADYGPDDFGVGTAGVYNGHINSNEWYRVVVTLDETTNTFSKYINGTLVSESIRILALP